MIRAADCPADPWANRKRICDLRLTSGSTSVHSDMITWSGEESAAGAALPILNALFATIQYSMILEKASGEHREVIRHWLRFSQEHRETLLKSDFRPRHPQNAYPLVEAESAKELIAAVYNPDTVAPATASKMSYVINATLSPSLVVEPDGAVRAEIYDTLGRKVSAADCARGLVRLSVPAGGFVKFTSR
jgi:alpha-galactosidase